MGSEKNSALVSFMIAFVIVVALIGFLIYGFDKKNRNYNVALDTKDLNKLAYDRFTSISSKRNILTNELIFFKDSKVDISNINKNDILYVAYTMLSKEDTTKSGEILDSCYNVKDNYPNECYLEVIDKNVLDEQINNYFSNDIKIDYNDFKISSNQTCYFKDNIYNCYLTKNEVNINNIITVNIYDSFEYSDDKLIVYSYLLTIRDRANKDFSEGVYSDVNASKLIDDLSYYDNEINKRINQDTSSKIVEYYKDKISKYKSVFVRENDNYVWLSTELDN